MRTDLDLAFADGEYRFRLDLIRTAELQEKTGAGLGELFARVLAGRYVQEGGPGFGLPTEAKWHVRDLIETIRLGLIGGGGGTTYDGQPVVVDALKAQKLVVEYCFPAAPLKGAWDLATAILTAAIEGVEDKEHEVKKKSVKPARTRGSSTRRSRSARSPASGLTPSPEPA